jgi:hypothetical protein
VGPCDVVKDTASFKICTQRTDTVDSCIRNWSGALACADGTGKYYAVGLVFSEMVRNKLESLI